MSEAISSELSSESSVSFLDIQEHNMSGSLTFEDGTPCIHRRIDVYIKGMFNYYKAAEMITDDQGAYHVSFQCRRLTMAPEQDVILKIFHTGLPWYENPPIARVVDEIAFSKPHSNQEYDPCLRPTQFLAYQDRFPFLRQPENQGWLPQQWGVYDIWLFIKEVTAGMFKSFSFRLGRGGYEDIVKEFSVSDRAVQHTSECTLQMLTRGVYMPVWQKTEVENEYEAVIEWDRYEQKWSSPRLPDAGIRIRVNKESIDESGQLLEPSSISIVSCWSQYKGYEKMKATSKDENFLEVLYNFNSAALVRGQADTHLQLHAEMEQVSIPAERYLIKNPIGAFIRPHQRETQIINQREIAGIFNGILRVSALTEEGVCAVVEDYLGARDYLDFSPRQAIYAEDRFAKAQQLWWDRFALVVEQFYQENEQKILEHWNEIYLFSEAYHKNSVAYRPWDGEENPNNWMDPSEVLNVNAPQREVGEDGVIRSVRRMTTVQKDPSAEEIENVKQFLRYVLCISMFRHSVIHLSQQEFATLQTASLAPEGNGTGLYAGTTYDNALEQSRMTETLVSVDREAMQGAIHNPHGDIHELVLQALEDLREPMADLGFNIDEIRHAIDI